MRSDFLAERLGSGDGERKTLLTRQIAFEPLPASVLFAPVRSSGRFISSVFPEHENLSPYGRIVARRTHRALAITVTGGLVDSGSLGGRLLRLRRGGASREERRKQRSQKQSCTSKWQQKPLKCYPRISPDMERVRAINVSDAALLVSS
jgi:hypothetical protein